MEGRNPQSEDAGEPALTIQDLDDVTEDGKLHALWPTVVLTVKAKSMSVFGLLTDSRLLSGDAGSITVEIAGEYHRTTLEKKDVKLVVDDAVAEVFRKPYKVKWQVRSKSGSGNSHPPSSMPASPSHVPSRPASPSPSFNPQSAIQNPQSGDDPAIGLGMKVFQGRVVPPHERRPRK